MAERNKNLEKVMGDGRIAIKGQITHVDSELIHGHRFTGPGPTCQYVVFGGQQGRPGLACGEPAERHRR